MQHQATCDRTDHVSAIKLSYPMERGSHIQTTTGTSLKYIAKSPVIPNKCWKLIGVGPNHAREPFDSVIVAWKTLQIHLI